VKNNLLKWLTFATPLQFLKRYSDHFVHSRVLEIAVTATPTRFACYIVSKPKQLYTIVIPPRPHSVRVSLEIY